MLTPRPYQIVGRDFLASRRHALLADEMRVGKTPQAILACAALDVQRAVVVCPAIAVQQWRREFARWWPECPQGHPPIYSFDKLRLNASHILSQRYEVAIVDEAHFAKNPDVQRTKLVYGKGGLGWCADHLWALSGTPAPKHAAELWPMLKAFGAVGMTYMEFVRYFCRYNEFTQRIEGTKEDKIPELRAILAKVMLRRTRKEVAPDMPEIAFDFLEVAPQKVDIKAPGLHGDKLLEWLEANPAANAEDRVAVAMAKVGPLSDEIEFAFANGLLKQTVCFGWHIEPLEKLAHVLGARGLRVGLITGKTSDAERQRVQAGFKAGELDAVVANILAAGTAIDLSAASHGYFLELDWVPGNNAQAANRLISMDKHEPVSLDVVTWRGSVDDEIQRVLLRRVRELSKLY